MDSRTTTSTLHLYMGTFYSIQTRNLYIDSESCGNTAAFHQLVQLTWANWTIIVCFPSFSLYVGNWTEYLDGVGTSIIPPPPSFQF